MSKEEAIAKLARVFRQYGYEGATLSRLSEATGLGKASLYHHFPQGKEEMARAVLSYTTECFKEGVLQPLSGSGDPAEKIGRMIENLDEFYNKGENTCILAMLVLGESQDLFEEEIGSAFEAWIEILTEVLLEAGINLEQARLRAEDAIIQIQGALILSRGLKDTAPFKRAIARLPATLLD